METKYNKEHALHVFFNILGNKTLKHVKKHFIWRNRTILQKNVCFKCFLNCYVPKRQNECKTLYGEMKGDDEKCVLWVFFELLKYQKSKMRQYHFIRRNKTLPKTFFFFFNSYVSKQRNAWKALYMLNKTIFLETCLLTVFELVSYQNAKMHGKQYWTTKTHNEKRVFWVFFSFFHNKTLKCSFCRNKLKLPIVCISSVFELG